MKKTFIHVLILFCVMTSCSKEDIFTSDNIDSSLEELKPEKESYARKGVIRIQLSESYKQTLKPTFTRTGIVSTGITELDVITKKLGVKEIKPVFQIGGKFLEVQLEHGLHLWYDFYFDETTPTTRAYNDISSIKGVQYAQPVYKLKPIPSQIKSVLFKSSIGCTTRSDKDSESNKTESNDPGFNDYFNDPLLKMQWNYNNEGLFTGFKAGADVNLFPAWKKETGKPEVVVAVFDGGIDINHEDLKNNLWVNKAELEGEANLDDDSNFYIDDIHGFNFATNTGKIVPNDHGTHVAGTIAATNNNNIGVSSIAGGDGTPNSGVRLMSCQIFDGEEQGDPAEAIQYAAENGAIIAQCSWIIPGYGSDQTLDKDLQTAIDYFTDVAGTDGSSKRTQVGPMKGGIVIFAVGNDDYNGKVIPSSYGRVFTVSGFAPNYVKATYSNYGSVANVSAPGGEEFIGTEALILSTLPGNEYGYMQGTSMACPHVSGIAALAISKFGQPGFTNKQLWDKLLRGTNDISFFNDSRDYLGVGYINADKVLSQKGEFAPNRVYDLSLDLITFNKARITWSITADLEFGKPDRFEVIWGTLPLWNISIDDFYDVISDQKEYVENSNRMQIRVPQSKKVGDQMTLTLENLEENEKYYFSIIAVNGNHISSPSTTVVGTTQPNQPPIIEGIPKSIVLKRNENRVVQLHIYDREEYDWDYTLDPGSGALTSTREGDFVYLHFNAFTDQPGKYIATLIAKDEQQLIRTIEIPYTILSNQSPELIQNWQTVLFKEIGEQYSIDLTQYFNDPDGDALTYEVDAIDGAIVSTNLVGSQLYLKSMAFGSTKLLIRAVDPSNESITTTVSIVCRDTKQLVDIYPSPVGIDGTLFIRCGDEITGPINVKLYNSFGAKVMDTNIQVESSKAAELDISKLSSGNYKVVVKYKTQKHSETITKL